MKKKILLPLFALMIVGGNNMRADNVLSVNPVSIMPGGTTELVVNIENDFNVYAYDFDLYLPEGIEVAKKDNGAYIYELKERNVDHGANVQAQTDGAIQFGVNSPTLALTGNSGEVLGITLKASASLGLGTYQASIKNITYANENGTKTVHPDNITFDILVTNQVVLDENSTVAPEASDGAVNVRVLRTINADVWSTICLPFAISEAQMQTAFGEDVNVELADFTDYEKTKEDGVIVGIKVNFTPVTSIEANHPYIIKVSKPVTQITVNSVDIAPTDNPCVEYDNGLTGRNRKVFGIFGGTYVADFDLYNEILAYYPLFLNNNNFYYATASTKHMKAFRAYFGFVDYLPEADAGVKMNIFVDGESTRIDGLLPETSNDAIYDLTGRKVEKAEKGIYIVNGKKVLVK